MENDAELDRVNFVKRGARSKTKEDRKDEVQGNKQCFGCGKFHNKDGQCPTMGQICAKCKKHNHFAAMCKTKTNNPKQKKKKKGKQINTVERDSEAEFYVGIVESTTKNKPWLIDTEINGNNVKMELDTGAHYNVISKKVLKEDGFKGSFRMDTENSKTLKSYSGHKIPVMGTKTIKCKINSKTHRLKFTLWNKQQKPF